MAIQSRYVTVLLTLSVVFTAVPEAHAGLIISANSDVIAGRNAFLAAGTTTTQFDWSSLFAPNSHTTGQVTPRIDVPLLSVTLPDFTVNTVIGANSHPTALALGNWVDAPGFNGPGNSAIADLAINAEESFDLVFGNGHRSVGLAIITGTGNLPDEVDITGATFMFTARDGIGNLSGSAIFSLAPGQADQVWLTITSDVSFQRLEVREIGAVGIADQYFSNILTSVQPVSAIPEPSSLSLLGMGVLDLLGWVCWQRRSREGQATALSLPDIPT